MTLGGIHAPTHVPANVERIIYIYLYLSMTTVVAQGHKRVSVNTIGCEFDFPSREWNIEYIYFLRTDVEKERSPEFDGKRSEAATDKKTLYLCSIRINVILNTGCCIIYSWHQKWKRNDFFLSSLACLKYFSKKYWIFKKSNSLLASNILRWF